MLVHKRLNSKFILAIVLCVILCDLAQASEVKSPSDDTQIALAQTFASLVRKSIPIAYERKKDWGNTKVITVGMRNEGHGWHLKLHRRKKAVKHGVWKHYRVNLVEPDKNLAVRIERLRSVDGGRIAFTLHLSTKVDCWARAKVYQYGVHLIALEVEGDARVDLAIDCEIGVHLLTKSGPGLAIDPRVVDAKLALRDFQIRRVSNAKGPLVRELGEELGELIEDNLDGPKLAAKLNRAIEKKRDRLQFGLGQLHDSSSWPLAIMKTGNRYQATEGRKQ